MSQAPTLAALLAAVRAHAPLSAWVADKTDADLSEIVRTARTTKGAIWLATRAAGPQEDATKQGGQEQTALACLRKLADAGHPLAAAALVAWEGAETLVAMDLRQDLGAELAMH